MKINITYIDSERAAVAALLSSIRATHPEAKVRETKYHPPYQHLYVTIKQPTKD